MAVDAVLDRVEHQAVAVQERVLLAGVDPPALQDLVADHVPVVDEPLDRVGDLELTTRGRLDRAHSIVDRGGEQIDTREREV